MDPAVSPPLAKDLLVVHVEDGLEETAAELHEVRILAHVPLLDPAAARGRERRAVGAALRFVEGQLLVDQDQRDRVIPRHYASVGFNVAAVIDTHDLQCGPGSVRVVIIFDLAAGARSMRWKNHCPFGRVCMF